MNPSGGLISKGHPLGATGLAQFSELCWAKVGLQHNIGLGGAAVVTMYKLGFPSSSSSSSSRYIQFECSHCTCPAPSSTPVFRLVVTKKRRESAHAHDSPFKIPIKMCACADSHRFFVTTNLKTGVGLLYTGGQRSHAKKCREIYS